MGRVSRAPVRGLDSGSYGAVCLASSEASPYHIALIFITTLVNLIPSWSQRAHLADDVAEPGGRRSIQPRKRGLGQGAQR